MLPPILSTPNLPDGQYGCGITFHSSPDSSLIVTPSEHSPGLPHTSDTANNPSPSPSSTTPAPRSATSLVRRPRVRTSSTVSTMQPDVSTKQQIIRRSRSAGEFLLPREKEADRRRVELGGDPGYDFDLASYDGDEDEDDRLGYGTSPPTQHVPQQYHPQPFQPQPHPYQHRAPQAIPFYNPSEPPLGPNAARRPPQPFFRQPPTPQSVQPLHATAPRPESLRRRAKSQTHAALHHVDSGHYLALTPHGRSFDIGSPIDYRHSSSQPQQQQTPHDVSISQYTQQGPYPGRLPQSFAHDEYPIAGSNEVTHPSAGTVHPPRLRPRALSTGGLERAGTLLSHGLGREQNARELKRILGQGGEDGHGRGLGTKEGKGKEGEVRLEAGKKKGRVEIEYVATFGTNRNLRHQKAKKVEEDVY